MHRVQESLAGRYPYTDEPYLQHVDETEVAVAYGNRAVPKLLRQFLNDKIDHVARRTALKESLDMMSHQETKLEFVTQGACGAAEELLVSPDALVRRLAAQIVASLATCPQGLELLLQSSSTTIRLCNMMDEQWEDTRIAAVTALETLSRTRAGAKEVVFRRSIVPKLVQILADKTNLRLLGPAVAALKNLCLVDEGKLQCLETPCMASLKGLVTLDDTLIVPALDCVFSLTCHPNGKVAAVNHKFAPLLVAFVQNPRLDVRKMAAGCIMMLTASAIGKAAISDAGGVLALKSLLSDDSADVKESAAASLRYLYELPVAKADMIDAFTPDELAQFK